MSVAGCRILVVGGGAAGIIAAWRAASLGADVLLLERNKKLGIKLLISGGGKCNITHAGTCEELLSAFNQREARFLKHALYTFSNSDIVRLIEQAGVKTYVRPNGRVFPASGNADDVVAALTSHLRKSGAEVRLNARVTGIDCEHGVVRGIQVGDELINSHHVILATGGVSYPKTGTTGDGIRWANAIGHSIVPLRPALAPMGVEPRLPVEWQGVAVRGGSLSLYAEGKKIHEWRDDILFTHEGISGPAALAISRIASEAAETQVVELRFDFFPSKELLLLDHDVNSAVLSQRNKMIGTILNEWLPNRIVPAVLRDSEVNPEKRGHVLTKGERRRIVGTMKAWRLGTVAHINIERGEVTAGGIALDEVEPKTMRSRRMKGLYLCGELLDIAGPIGGYNLQVAFSTGYVAGEAAAKDLLERRSSFHALTGS